MTDGQKAGAGEPGQVPGSARPLDRLLPLLEGVFGCDPAEREAWLLEACPDDPALRMRVLTMASCEDAGDDFLEPGTGPGRLFQPEVGQNVGAWRLVRPIGRGGMGEVWLGERADGAFDMHVAIKLLHFGFDAAMSERFRRERQVLADLDHRGVARLLDGGVTDSGMAYLVLEYVEGVPIDVYCSERSLPVREVLRLFLAVCAAVQHAHSRLVVHRDVKPANVLVTPRGEPKLLDFGIARILSDSAGATRALDRLGTPRYASPEQVTGGPVSTATDVYSLGALLYHLLAGRPPLDLDSQDTLSWAHKIAREIPPRASRVATTKRRTHLAGDLDAILAKSLSKEPSQRYGSVEALAADVRRHLSGVPVRARPGSVRYRLQRFVRRNPVRVAGALALGCVVLGWASSATWQFLRTREALAHARNERERAVAAEAQERRTRTALEQYAGSILFGVHDEIQRLPGATRARERLIELTIEHLQSLERHQGGGRAPARYLAESYQRLGDVQSSTVPFGNSASALVSYEESLRWLQVLEEAVDRPPDLDARRAALEIKVGALLADLGKVQAATGRLDRAEEALGPGHDLSAVALELQRGDLAASRSRPEEADQAYRRALALADAGVAAGASPGRAWRRDRGLVLERLAIGLQVRGKYQESEAMHRECVRECRGLVEAWPGDAQLAGDLARALANLGALLQNAGKFDEALAPMEESCALFLPLVEVDPHDSSLRGPLARCLSNWAGVLKELDRGEKALEVAREGLMHARLVAEGAGENPQAQLVLATALYDVGRYARELGYATLAAEHLEQAETLAAGLSAGAEVRRLRADVAMQQGYDALRRKEPSLALASFDRAHRLFGRVIDDDPENAHCARSHMVARSCMGVAVRTEALERSGNERYSLLEEARDAFVWTLERHAELERLGYTRPRDARAAELFRSDLRQVEEALADLDGEPAADRRLE